MQAPSKTSGLRHVALWVKNFEQTRDFYTQLLQMETEWEPDPDNIYLCSGCDNLALHRLPEDAVFSERQHLDHIGFILETPELVDAWYAYLQAHQVPMKTAPRTHRDGARSFYCLDPDGNTVQLIYHPPIVGTVQCSTSKVQAGP